MRLPRWLPSLLAAVALPAVIPAQTVELAAVGGSLPGKLQWVLGPGTPAKQCTVIISISPGPTPLAPIDPRTLMVGIESIGLSVVGFYNPADRNLHRWPNPAVSVPANTSFNGQAIYSQGLDFPGPGRLIGAISNLAVTRFGIAGTFQYRGAKLKTARSFGEVAKIGPSRWMSIGGGRGGILAQIALQTTEIYDIKNDAWITGPIMQAPHTLHQVTELPDGRILVTGGLDGSQAPQDTAEVYVPSTNSFKLVSKMNSKRSGHRALVLESGPNKGKVLVIGGFTLPAQPGNFLTILNSTTTTTEIWDPKTDKWTPGPNLSVPRSSFETYTRPDGKILICGGVGWIRFLGIKVPTIFNTTDLYDPATNKITPGPAMKTPHAAYAHLDLGNGRFGVFGGGDQISLTNPGRATKACEIYDARTNGWTRIGDLKEARAFADAYHVGGGKVIVVGGFKNNLVQPIGLRTTEILSGTTWSSGPNLAQDLAAYGSIVTPMGQIQFVGGQGSQGQNVVARNDTFLFYP